MDEERDLMGIAIPFAAGIAAGMTFLASGIGPWHHAMASVAMTFTVGASLALAPIHKRNAAIGKAGFAIVFLLAGLFCSLNSRLTCLIPPSDGIGLSAVAQDACGKLKACIDGIPYRTESTPSLLKALLTGDRSGLSKETISIFRESGASHILALSGLHLGIIYLIINRFLTILGNRPAVRRWRSCLVVGVSFFYCLMTGAGASIVRAFLFILITETARVTGREKRPLMTLLAAMTVQLAIKPEIIETLGFQLSYLAMAGIFLVYPTLESIYPLPEGHFWRKVDPMRKLWQSTSMSLSCQVLTAPLVWFKFHTFPKYFMVTNLVALPLTSAIMVLSVATVALSALGICPMFLVDLDDKAVQALVFCLRTIASL